MKEFILGMKKDCVKLFQRRFVLCLIKMLFVVLMKKMLTKLHKVEQQFSDDRDRKCDVVMVT